MSFQVNFEHQDGHASNFAPCMPCVFSVAPQQGVISCQPHPKPLNYLYKLLLFPLPSNFGIHYQIIFCPVLLLFLPNVPYPFDWALLVYLVLIFFKIELKSTFYSE